jgi:hypothetical protein
MHTELRNVCNILGEKLKGRHQLCIPSNRWCDDDDDDDNNNNNNNNVWGVDYI